MKRKDPVCFFVKTFVGIMLWWVRRWEEGSLGNLRQDRRSEPARFTDPLLDGAQHKSINSPEYGADLEVLADILDAVLGRGNKLWDEWEDGLQVLLCHHILLVEQGCGFVDGRRSKS